jgi:hypothetical protein
MNRTWLYGIEVISSFPLFPTATPAAAAPGEHADIRLQAMHKDTDEYSHSYLKSGLSEQLTFEQTHGRQLALFSDRPLADSAPGQPCYLEVKDVVRFCWRSGENTIGYEFLEQGSRQLFVFWFTHIFLPLYLTLERGYDFLHAAAVEMDAGPVLFVAPSTGGKSTLADYCLQRGHALFSDDKVATFSHQGQYWAAPSHPHHRPWREFEVLGQPVANVARRANPIKAIYCLQAADPEAGVHIEAVQGFRKFEELLPNYLFSLDYLRARRLAWLARMAEVIPVYRVSRPWELSQMEQTYRALRAHAAAL